MKRILIITLLLYNATLFSQSQRVIAGVRGQALFTTSQPIYNTIGGLGIGPSLRFQPWHWIYLQGGCVFGTLFSNESQIEKYKLNTLDWQLGFIPIQKYPVHLSIGGLRHRYKIETKEVTDYGYVFIPALKEKRVIDGLNIGVGYTIKQRFEFHLRYEREPFRHKSDHPLMTNFIKIEVYWFFDWRKKSAIQT